MARPQDMAVAMVAAAAVGGIGTEVEGVVVVVEIVEEGEFHFQCTKLIHLNLRRFVYAFLCVLKIVKIYIVNVFYY